MNHFLIVAGVFLILWRLSDMSQALVRITAAVTALVATTASLAQEVRDYASQPPEERDDDELNALADKLEAANSSAADALGVHPTTGEPTSGGTLDQAGQESGGTATGTDTGAAAGGTPAGDGSPPSDGSVAAGEEAAAGSTSTAAGGDDLS